MFSKRIILGYGLLLGLGGLLTAGCNSTGSGNVGAIQTVDAKSAGEVKATAGQPTRSSMLLRRGPAPITHMVTSGGQLYVIDAYNRSTLVQTSLPHQATTITVDQDKGISVGTDTKLHGPLPAGHQYELWLDVTKQD